MNRREFVTVAAGATAVSLLAGRCPLRADPAGSSDETSPYKAWLRYYIGEEFDIPKRTEAVAAFCRRVGIDGVMLFSAAFEHQPWVLTREEYIKRAAAMGQAATILRQHGLGIDINVLITLGHVDAGPKPDGMPFPFQRMVDISGTVADSVPCPLDPNYIRHMAEFYAELVRQVRPEVIFADDDFRMTNHAPTINTGCFCPLHRKKLAEAMGKSDMTLEEARALLAEGPKKVETRELFARVMQDGMLGVTLAIRKAIDDVAPETRFGLMTSYPSNDRVMGRDYRTLAKAAAGKTRPIIRPNLGMYREGERRALPAAVDRTFWSASLVGPEVECITEVDGNWPHTRFYRSAATVLSNIVTTTFGGVANQSLFLYGFLDKPFDEDPEYGDTLQKHRRMFRVLARIVADCRPLEGVRVWYDHDRSAFHKCVPAPSQEYFVTSRDWISRLALNGLPIAYSTEGPSILQGDEGYAITKEQLCRELQQGVLVDADAAKALVERGLGAEIGLEAMPTINSQVTTEHLDVAEFAGSYFNRKITINPCYVPRSSFHRLVARPGARAASTLLELDATPVGPGMLVFKNAEGGRAAVMAYAQDGESGATIFASFGRQSQLRAVFEWLGRKPLPVIAEHTADLWVMIRRRPGNDRAVVMAANLSFDPVSEFALTVGQLPSGRWKVSRLQPDGSLLLLGQQESAGTKTTFQLTSRIEPQEAAVFELSRVG